MFIQDCHSLSSYHLTTHNKYQLIFARYSKKKIDNVPLPSDVMNLNKYFKGNNEDFSMYFKYY